MTNNIIDDNNLIKFKKITYPGVPENRYLISEFGDVYSTISNKLLKPIIDKYGYHRYGFPNRKHVLAHRLVGWEFLPETRNLELTIDHLDTNKLHNHYTNLEWVTSTENTHRAEINGIRNVRGSNNGNNKYSEEFIHDICSLLESNGVMDTYRIIKKSNDPIRTNEDYALYQLIFKIKKRLIWPDITSQYKYNTESDINSKKIYTVNENNRFSEDDIHNICKMILDGKSNIDILSEFNIDKRHPDYTKHYQKIRDIRSGKNWTYISSQYFDNTFHKPISNKKYDIDNEKIYRLVDHGYSNEDILVEFGLGYGTKNKDDQLLHRAIRRRITSYRKFQHFDNSNNMLIDKSILS